MTTNSSGGVKARIQVQEDRLGSAKDGRTLPAPPLGTFRAFWPITDECIPMARLIQQARADLPMLTAQAHAVLRGRGRWTVERSCEVPGSGRVTEWLLMYNAPAAVGRVPFEDSQEVA